MVSVLLRTLVLLDLEAVGKIASASLPNAGSTSSLRPPKPQEEVVRIVKSLGMEPLELTIPELEPWSGGFPARAKGQ